MTLLEKCKQTILGCQTQDQVKVAARYVNLAAKRQEFNTAEHHHLRVMVKNRMVQLAGSKRLFA